MTLYSSSGKKKKDCLLVFHYFKKTFSVGRNHGRSVEKTFWKHFSVGRQNTVGQWRTSKQSFFLALLWYTTHRYHHGIILHNSSLAGAEFCRHILQHTIFTVSHNILSLHCLNTKASTGWSMNISDYGRHIDVKSWLKIEYAINVCIWITSLFSKMWMPEW